MGFGGYGLFGGLGMGFGMIIWILILGLIVWAVVSQFNGQPIARQDSALDILKQRYAGGELSKAEFEQAKRDVA